MRNNINGKIFRQADFDLFIRSLEPKEYSIKELRDKYFFLSDYRFSEIIQKLIFQNVLIFDMDNKNVTFPIKYFNLISFLDKTNFIYEIENIKDDINYKLNSQMTNILNKINFGERITKDNKFINIKEELSLSLKEIYNDNYDNEIANILVLTTRFGQ